MEFRLLGPMEVADQDRPLDLGALKQRSLLAVLLLNANDVVSVERLVDEVWGESPPATVGKSVQVYVSRLRRQLGADRLVTRAPGYLLRVDPGELDLERFERLVAEAGSAAPSRAASLLREALALWCGPPLADLAYEPFSQPHILRLQELRLMALEQRIEAELAVGRQAELVGELEALVAEHPLRERLRGQLMLALYRCGRQAEALDAYRDARVALTDELGIEPSRALRELQQAILRQEAGLEPAAVKASAHIAAGRDTERGDAFGRDRGSVFVGRERELTGLLAALDDAFAGRGRVALLSGEPGIGKSRLADELIARARARDALVLVGRCWEAGGAPAFWPWVQSLRAYVRDADPAAVRSQLGAGGASVAEILPELRELTPDLGEPAAIEPEGARFRLFDAVSSFIRSAADARPLVLVLDDLHAADEPSLLLLRFVAREIAASRVVLLCAFRDVDPSLRDPLVSALAELVREPQTMQIALPGLNQADVGEYIERSTGIAPTATLVQAIRAGTEGNPLFVGEVVRLLDGEGGIAEADAELRIPPGVRAVIGRRTGRLSDPCRRILVAASVLGREFGLDALALVAEVSRDELLEVLDEAMTERLVSDVPGSTGRLRFHHALFRDTIYDELTPTRRLRLHQRAGAALEAVYSADPEPHLAELARHFVAAAPAGAAGKAIDYARRAGDRAVSQLAYEEAARHYETAIALIEQPAARCELLLELGDALARAGDTPASKRAYRIAAELAERAGMAEQLAHAALGYGGRLMWDVSRDDELLVPLVERVIATLGDDDSALRVRLLARLAGGPLRDSSFPPDRKAALRAQALEMARRLAALPTLAYAIQSYILGHHSPDHVHKQLELATELVDVATRAGDKEGVSRPTRNGSTPGSSSVTWALVAHIRSDHARMLLTCARPEDRERARELRAGACATYADLGMDAHAARTGALGEGPAVRP
jgi:DNA-binding SARP family transcriptional activator